MEKKYVNEADRAYNEKIVTDTAQILDDLALITNIPHMAYDVAVYMAAYNRERATDFTPAYVGGTRTWDHWRRVCNELTRIKPQFYGNDTMHQVL
jgi:hypothetical protein